MSKQWYFAPFRRNNKILLAIQLWNFERKIAQAYMNAVADFYQDSGEALNHKQAEISSNKQQTRHVAVDNQKKNSTRPRVIISHREYYVCQRLWRKKIRVATE